MYFKLFESLGRGVICVKRCKSNFRGYLGKEMVCDVLGILYSLVLLKCVVRVMGMKVER